MEQKPMNQSELTSRLENIRQTAESLETQCDQLLTDIRAPIIGSARTVNIVHDRFPVLNQALYRKEEFFD